MQEREHYRFHLAITSAEDEAGGVRSASRVPAREVVEGRTPLLLLDEAQDLRNGVRADRDVLGMIQALTNLMLENERLVQIILFGQLELVPLLKKRRGANEPGSAVWRALPPGERRRYSNDGAPLGDGRC